MTLANQPHLPDPSYQPLLTDPWTLAFIHSPSEPRSHISFTLTGTPGRGDQNPLSIELQQWRFCNEGEPRVYFTTRRPASFSCPTTRTTPTVTFLSRQRETDRPTDRPTQGIHSPGIKLLLQPWRVSSRSLSYQPNRKQVCFFPQHRLRCNPHISFLFARCSSISPIGLHCHAVFVILSALAVVLLFRFPIPFARLTSPSLVESAARRSPTVPTPAFASTFVRPLFPTQRTRRPGVDNPDNNLTSPRARSRIFENGTLTGSLVFHRRHLALRPRALLPPSLRRRGHERKTITSRRVQR